MSASHVDTSNLNRGRIRRPDQILKVPGNRISSLPRASVDVAHAHAGELPHRRQKTRPMLAPQVEQITVAVRPKEDLAQIAA